MGDKVLYGLYGIVEHSGSMREGHYTAYVKVRVPSRKLLEHITGKKNVPGMSSYVYVILKNKFILPFLEEANCSLDIPQVDSLC